MPVSSIAPDILTQITENLDKLEQVHGIRVLYACESGSRAWRFASTDSDYDVRFIYARPIDWYLSIQAKRDVIELPISDQLDICGWDLPKTLLLYRKTNPPLFEWLGSPIVYRDQFDVAKRLRELAPDYYCTKAAAYHYLRMAQNTY